MDRTRTERVLYLPLISAVIAVKTHTHTHARTHTHAQTHTHARTHAHTYTTTTTTTTNKQETARTPNERFLAFNTQA